MGEAYRKSGHRAAQAGLRMDDRDLVNGASAMVQV